MQGLIIENAANLYKVKVIDRIYNCTARGKIKQDELTPLVGDFAEITVINEVNGEAVIEKVTHRKTEIKRPRLANISQLVLIVSMKDPSPDLLLLDKQLAFAEFLKINALIVLNKMDLDTRSEYKRIEEIYQKIGYKVFETDAMTGIGISTLKDALLNNRNAFSGSSGVGKSSIINQIIGKEVALPGAVSEKNGRGKNTTTITKLYDIGPSTFIADTPGFSVFDVDDIPPLELDKCFREFKNYRKNCKYDDCSHVNEIDCGVKAAIKKGIVDSIRYDHYVKIYNELKEKEAHQWE